MNYNFAETKKTTIVSDFELKSLLYTLQYNRLIHKENYYQQ